MNKNVFFDLHAKLKFSANFPSSASARHTSRTLAPLPPLPATKYSCSSPRFPTASCCSQLSSQLCPSSLCPGGFAQPSCFQKFLHLPEYSYSSPLPPVLRRALLPVSRWVYPAFSLPVAQPPITVAPGFPPRLLWPGGFAQPSCYCCSCP